MAQEVQHDTSDPDNRRKQKSGGCNSRWWKADIAEEGTTAVHDRLVPYVQRLRAAWTRMEIFERAMDRMYENRSLKSNRGALAVLEQVGFNAARLMVTTSIVDTFTARLSRRRPMPMFVVDEGEWSLKQQAIEMRAFVHGKMREHEVDEKSDEGGNDACVRGNGIVYVGDAEDDVVVERVHRRELLVDPHEAKGGPNAVRQMHRVRRMAREVLVAEYPDMADKIGHAPASRIRPGESGAEDWASPAGFYDESDVIDVYESWHLPSCDDYDEDETDGRWARCIEGATLEFCTWTEQRFPFAILRRHLRKDSFWGQGDVERLAPLQHSINKMAADIQENIETAGKLYLFTSGSADNIPTEKFTGVRSMRVKGAAPGQVQFHAPTAISPAHQSILDSRIEYAYRFSGAADWAATARSPLGEGASGVALDTMEDLLSDRHASFEMRYSAWRCMIAQLIIDAAKRIAKRMKAGKDEGEAAADGDERKKPNKYTATWMNAGTLRRIAWDDAEMEDGSYRLEIEGTSYLPTTRGGKLAALTELVKNGIVPQWAAAGAFEEPDIAHTNRIVLAKYHNAERIMQILGDPTKEAPTPLPYHDLDLLLAFGVAYYNRAECDRAPEEVLARYGAFIDLVIEEKKKPGAATGGAEIPNPAGMLAPPGPGGAPGGGPPMPAGGPAMPMEMPAGAPGMMPQGAPA